MAIKSINNHKYFASHRNKWHTFPYISSCSGFTLQVTMLAPFGRIQLNNFCYRVKFCRFLFLILLRSKDSNCKVSGNYKANTYLVDHIPESYRRLSLYMTDWVEASSAGMYAWAYNSKGFGVFNTSVPGTVKALCGNPAVHAGCMARVSICRRYVSSKAKPAEMWVGNWRWGQPNLIHCSSF